MNHAITVYYPDGSTAYEHDQHPDTATVAHVAIMLRAAVALAESLDMHVYVEETAAAEFERHLCQSTADSKR